MFTIKKNSTSFKFLITWDSDFSYFSKAKDYELENVNSLIWKDIPNTFCAYYWKVFKTILFASWVITFVIVMGGGLLTFILLPLLWLIPDNSIFEFHKLAKTASIVDIVTIICAILFYMYYSFNTCRKNHKIYHAKNVIKASWFKTAYAAWKEKYCPLIEYDFVSEILNKK